MTIGEYIKKVRKEKGITQKELAEKLNVSQQNLSQYENDKRIPKLQSMVRIASALEIDANELASLYQDTVGYPLPLDRIVSHPSLHPQSAQEAMHIINYRKLNNLGKIRSDKYTEDLSKIPEYRQDTTPDHPDQDTPQNK